MNYNNDTNTSIKGGFTMSDEQYRETFVRNLNYYMKKKNKTQQDLIDDLGLSSSTVSNWCTGARLPRMGKIQMLADYLGIKKTDLLEDKPTDSAPAEVTDDDIKFALFGGADDITYAQFEEVKAFARFIRERDKNEKDKKN